MKQVTSLVAPAHTPAPSLKLTLMLALVLVLTAACGKKSGEDFNFESLPPTPAAHAEGERLYNANCASCHGPKGSGSAQGPALVHIVYEPSHHSDAAFQLAVQRGVVAHHWRFGNMAPVPGVTPEQTTMITSYVRWIQRQAGIQ
jgi:mono/diheme cytochrome c family protein